MNSFWRSFGGQFARRRGTPGNSWWGSATRFFKSSPDFRPKKCNFPHPFSDKTSKIHTRFQIWPLGRNYVMITQIRAQTKKLFTPFRIRIFLFLSYSFGVETINTFIHSVVPSKTIPDFRPNAQRVYPFSDQNGAKTIPDEGGTHTPIWLI